MTQCNPESVVQSSPFTINLVSASEDTSLSPSSGEDLFAIRYSKQTDNRQAPSSPQVGLQVLGNGQQLEHWHVASPLRCEKTNAIEYRLNDDMLFGWIQIEETDTGRIGSLTQSIYQQIEAMRKQTGFPHLLRIWNYFPDINASADNGTRYQDFCQGRHSALQQDSEFISRLPAATVIGTYSPGYIVYFLAARQPGIPIANPRQVNPFEYPRQYGPNSPSFVRAMVKHWQQRSDLYISGTASIVGHESLHTGNTLKQLDETLSNLDTLILQANRQEGISIRATAELSNIKVYLRNAKDYEIVKQRLDERLGKNIPRLFLHGEICRDDLLIEIEGVYIDE